MRLDMTWTLFCGQPTTHGALSRSDLSWVLEVEEPGGRRAVALLGVEMVYSHRSEGTAWRSQSF